MVMECEKIGIGLGMYKCSRGQGMLSAENESRRVNQERR